MPSFVWDRDPSEAYSEPYEYGAQEQFAREATQVIKYLKTHYQKLDRTFQLDDCSAIRAVWMLQVDALSALSDSLELLSEKNFRVASRLFRDVIETLDASCYFALAGSKANANLAKWYKNEIISHRVFREFVKEYHGPKKAEHLRGLYTNLSKYTHRTYHALSMSYLLGQSNASIYDGFRDNENMLVLPHVISFSYAMLAGLIKRFVQFGLDTKQIDSTHEADLWNQSLETETVARRFGYGPGQLRRGPPMPIE